MSEPDFNCYDAVELDFDKLDPGIRETVRWLISLGFETTDSGDGAYKLAHGWDEDDLVPVPHVYIATERRSMLDVADRLKRECERVGLDVRECGAGLSIQASYDPINGNAVVGLYNLDDRLLEAARKDEP